MKRRSAESPRRRSATKLRIESCCARRGDLWCCAAPRRDSRTSAEARTGKATGKASLTRGRRSLYPCRHMSRKRWAPGHSLFLGLGLFVVLSHVCALPVHAAGLATLVGHTHGAHETSADESVHGASCEAVRSTFTVAPPVLPATPATSVRVVTQIVQRPLERPLSVFATSPPLFLLHASFLI